MLNAADDFDGLYRYGPTPQEAAAAAAAAAAPAAEAAQAVKAAKAAKATQKACVAAEAAAEATASAAALAKRAATRAAARVRRRQRGSLAAQRLCAAKRLQHAYHVFVYNKRVHKLREFAHAIQFTVRQRRQAISYYICTSTLRYSSMIYSCEIVLDTIATLTNNIPQHPYTSISVQKSYILTGIQIPLIEVLSQVVEHFGEK